MHESTNLARRVAIAAAAAVVAAAITLVVAVFIYDPREAPLFLAVAGLTAVATAILAAVTGAILSRRGLEAALADNRRTLTDLQNIAGIGHFSFDMYGGPVFWSENMYAIHGMTPGSFQPSRHTFFDLVLPDDRTRFLAQLEKPGSVTKPGGFICRIRKPDGTVRYMSYDWRAVHDVETGRHKAFGVAQDVTAMRAAEDALREKETRLRDLLECTSDFIWETDENGRVTHMAGRGIGDLYDAIGRPGSEMIAESDEPADTANMKVAIRSRASFRNLLIPMKGRDGGVRWIRGSGNPRFDVTGRFLGYRGASTDFTETRMRRRQDEEHRKAEALGRLASGVAHEINNLLQPILIYASTGSADAASDSSAHRHFSRISRATERAMIILKNVLTFARQSPPKRKDVKAIDIVREAVDLVGGVLPSRVQLELVSQSPATLVAVDPTGLGQVVTNLITNAAEAIQGRGRIRVTLRDVFVQTSEAGQYVEPGPYCLLEVEDDGPGIPPHLISQVFDPFFTTKSQGQGTGLGLSVVAGLTRSWGGSVRVISQPNLRTVFTVYLPTAQVARLAAE